MIPGYLFIILYLLRLNVLEINTLNKHLERFNDGTRKILYE